MHGGLSTAFFTLAKSLLTLRELRTKDGETANYLEQLRRGD